MMKFSHIDLVVAAAILFSGCVDANAGCKWGDVLMNDGPHAGQCAHKGSTNSTLQSTVSLSIAMMKSGAQKTVTQHPFKDVPATTQFRCQQLADGSRVPYDGPNEGDGYGWCTN